MMPFFFGPRQITASSGEAEVKISSASTPIALGMEGPQMSTSRRPTFASGEAWAM
ncbi:hypothetical protein TYRP_015643 [Tyrophagus putrescentiae]|nr:hypothetical protein TYRP_015643 [Tyrophagus putrescentiae]